MDYAACHVVYVDRRAREERFVKKDSVASSTVAKDIEGDSDYSDVKQDLVEDEEVQLNIRSILSIFNGGTFYNALEIAWFFASE